MERAHPNKVGRKGTQEELKPRIYRVTALSRHLSRVGNGNVAARGNATHCGTDRADNRPLTLSTLNARSAAQR